jgi:hypothetical protein
MAKEILCGFGVDVDAVAGWLDSYGGDDSPGNIARGLLPERSAALAGNMPARMTFKFRLTCRWRKTDSNHRSRP